MQTTFRFTARVNVPLKMLWLYFVSSKQILILFALIAVDIPKSLKTKPRKKKDRCMFVIVYCYDTFYSVVCISLYQLKWRIVKKATGQETHQ